MHIPSALHSHWQLAVAGFTLLFGVVNATAAVIGISGSATHLSVGQHVDVDFHISGLSAAPGQSLGGFDLDVTYDPAILMLTSIGFTDNASGTNQLDWIESGSFGFIGNGTAGPGAIDAFCISGNSTSVLDTYQANTFRFLHLRFEALAPSAGASVAIDVLDPGLLFIDSGANRLPADIPMAGFVLAISGTSAAPEPASLPLLAAGLAALAACTRWHGRRTALACALLLGLGMEPGDAKAQAPVATEPPVQADASPPLVKHIEGVIVAIRGQRVQVRLEGGALRWFSTGASLPPSAIGKKITGNATHRGDADMIDAPVLAN